VLFAGGSFSTGSRCGADIGKLGAAVLAGEKIVDYFWHLTLPLIAMALGAFATVTLLTKNSFLDEIRKQYVMTARAKGLTERRCFMAMCSAMRC
jgi:microcin C transport system permease protein